ncbi:MAG: hypothetical protein KAT09_04215, partial [Candidatus Aegiribacteria sp.]|nr:hypothetical protein [Candidatus Aegiribacteria sp.]
MKTVINGSRYLLILLLIPSVPFAAYSYQTNWSGGPGVPGPTTWWGGSFSSQAYTSWTVIPGKLLLGVSTVS